ncbi:hypothetical protein GS966_02505 [Rhodococcus hoagii]|nr:hypothetical protein [Prescottella equi]NKZ88799.1 hypothetical protein [Prescottella equi]
MSKSTLYSPASDSPLSVGNVLNNSDFMAGVIANGLTSSLASTLYGNAQDVATGGAVLYQSISAGDLYADDEINARAEGTEYQIVRLPDPDIKRDPVEDLGGAFEVTDEAWERNVLDVAHNGLIQVSNSIRRKLDRRIAATLAAAPIETIAATDEWGGFTTTGSNPTPRGQQPIGDMIRLDESFQADEFGQGLQTLLLNPIDATKVRLGYGEELPNVLAAVSRGENPVKIKATTMIAAGTGYALSQSSPGALGVEKPLTVEKIPVRDRRTTRVQAYIVCRPYISRLYAIRKIIGI